MSARAGIRRDAPRAAGLLAAALVGLGLLGAPVRGAGQSLGTLAVDFLASDRHGHHVLVVSALDPNGQPLTGLEHAFSAEIDGHSVQNLIARPARARGARAELALVVDGALFGGDARAGIADALRALAGSMAPGDRVRLVSAGRRLRDVTSEASRLGALADRLAPLEDDEAPMLYDALRDAAQRESRRDGDAPGAIVVVTRGLDGGSSHTLLEALALARTSTRLTPVVVVIVADRGSAPEADRLERLAAHSAGALLHVTSPLDLPSALPGAVARGLERWTLTCDVPGWSAESPAHHGVLTASVGGEQREATFDYASADVLPPPWWRSPLAWIVPVVLLVAGLALLLSTRRRQLALLVHDGDDEDGAWYEIFAFPVTVGAAAGNDLVLAGGTVSRNHAILERRGRTVELTDLNSENGTFVNGEPIARRALVDGDRVSIGPDVHLIYETRG